MSKHSWTLVVAVILSIFGSIAASADMDPAFYVRGKVGNFNEKSVELILENGTHIRVPRSRFDEKTDLSPGKQVGVAVLVDEIDFIQQKRVR